MTISARRSAPPAEARPQDLTSRRLRILPVVIVCSVVLLTLKSFHIGAGIGAVLGPALAGSPLAEASDAPARVYEFAAIAPASGQATGDGGGTAGEETQPAVDPVNDEEVGLADQPAFMSRSELDLLQDLSNRRQELDSRRQQLDTRERLLMATEKRIDKKIERLKGIETEIKDLLRIHSEEEEAQLKSLVKVYEAMKPKDAARIFEKLDMDILINVIERMKERKVAPVLAEMDPDSAKALTIELATRKQLPAVDEQG